MSNYPLQESKHTLISTRCSLSCDSVIEFKFRSEIRGRIFETLVCMDRNEVTENLTLGDKFEIQISAKKEAE